MSIYSYICLRDSLIFRDKKEKKKLLSKELNLNEKDILEIIVAENCIYVETKSEIIKIFSHGILREVKA